MVRDAPYSGLYLMFYTQLKQNVSSTLLQVHPALDVRNNGYLASITHFSCGISAGLLASLVSKSDSMNFENSMVKDLG